MCRKIAEVGRTDPYHLNEQSPSGPKESQRFFQMRAELIESNE